MNALTLFNARRCAVGATLVAASLVAVPAPSAQSQSPAAPGCYGTAFKDKEGDVSRAHPGGFTDKPENLDLLDSWFSDDGSKTVVHMRIKNLTKDLPQGATAIQWQVEYGGSTTGAPAWIRAAVDFTGLVDYDYGGQEEAGLTWNMRQGDVEGDFVEGPNGVVSIAFPDQEAKGTKLKAFIAHAYEAVQTLPSAAPTPVKGGLLYEADNASGGKYQHTVGGPCPAAPPAVPAVTPGLPTAVTPVAAEKPLAIKVSTKSVSAKRSKKSITLKLKATEPLTKVGAQLVKGKKVYAKGSLAKLSGSGKMKLKVTRKLRKGTYRLDLAGTDATGDRRLAAARLKVK